MVSNPPFDPNRVPSICNQLNKDPSSPLFDRATQGQYPPGSTFKVVTAAAGARQRHDHARHADRLPGDARRPGAARCPTTSAQRLRRRSALDTALTNSVNTFFAQLGEQVGEDTLYEYMNALRLQLQAADRPALATSSRSAASSTAATCSSPNDAIDIARVAIGQERLLATPLQMAEVAATIANGGDLMKPQIWDEVGRSRRPRSTKRMEPSEQSEVMSRSRPRPS